MPPSKYIIIIFFEFLNTVMLSFLEYSKKSYMSALNQLLYATSHNIHNIHQEKSYYVKSLVSTFSNMSTRVNHTEDK